MAPFTENLSTQIAKKGISEHRNFKIYFAESENHAPRTFVQSQNVFESTRRELAGRLLQ